MQNHKSQIYTIDAEAWRNPPCILNPTVVATMVGFKIQGGL